MPDDSKSQGLLDTNVLIHSLTNDANSAECRTFLRLVQAGERRVRLEPYVVHEMSYALSRVLKHTRQEIAEELLALTQWSGIDCDQELIPAAIIRWRDRPSVSFADALLAAEAIRSQTRVFTVNVRDFNDTGIEVPAPLSSFQP